MGKIENQIVERIEDSRDDFREHKAVVRDIGESPGTTCENVSLNGDLKVKRLKSEDKGGYA